MTVYLVRHGRPRSEVEDPARPLSDAGEREVREVAAFLSRQGVRVSAIHHSGKLRAKQTAEIIAGFLRPPARCSPAAGLAPLDEPGHWHERLAAPLVAPFSHSGTEIPITHSFLLFQMVASSITTRMPLQPAGRPQTT